MINGNMSTWQFQFWTEVICEEHAGDEGPAEDSSSDVDEVHFGKKNMDSAT